MIVDQGSNPKIKISFSSPQFEYRIYVWIMYYTNTHPQGKNDLIGHDKLCRFFLNAVCGEQSNYIVSHFHPHNIDRKEK